MKTALYPLRCIRISAMNGVLRARATRRHSWLAALMFPMLTSLLTAAGLETWTDAQGRKLQAEYLGRQMETVHLRTPDGVTHAIPLTRLSVEDVKRIRQLPEKMQAAVGTLQALTPEQSAERIDRVVEAHLAAKQIKPNPALTEEQFIRRAYLDIAGRIPKLEETRAYLGDKTRNKRALLTDRLLRTPGHHSHLFNYFASLLRLKTRVSEYISGASFNTWVKQCIAENKPYDQMVREMLTASGTYQNNPAAGYLMRDAGMSLDNLSLTSQCFLGTDLSCAQCHDHPFDDWTQKQFYHLAAFLGSTRTTPNGDVLKAEFAKAGKEWVPAEKVVEEAFEHREYDGVVKEAMKRFIHAAQHRVADDPKLVLKLPHDYKYSDGKPGDVVEPKVIFGTMPDLAKFDSNRAAFAQWLTADDIPRFAITIANRLWKRAFGRGVVEPVHDLEDLSFASIPGLIEVLGEEMKRVRYDLRAFEAILYRTRSWQRQASLTSPIMGAAYDFPGPLLRRLSAAQVWDSILAMVLEDPDYFNGKRDYKEWEKTFAFDRTSVTGKIFADSFAKQEALQQREGGFFGWPKEEGVRPTNQALWIDDRVGAWCLYGDVLIRASELPQPAPPGHLLSILGQSNRELSDGDTTIGSVPIVLTVMNGSGSKVLTQAGSRILNAVDEFKADGPKVDAVFLSVLSRLPTPDERSTAYKAIRRDGKKGFEDVCWSLLNTREFLFVQ